VKTLIFKGFRAARAEKRPFGGLNLLSFCLDRPLAGLDFRGPVTGKAGKSGKITAGWAWPILLSALTVAGF
jgi:hypothetical protein